MKRLLVCGLLLAACDPENGEPDPPLANLVPCDPNATADSPLACPPDAGAVVTDGSANIDASPQDEDAAQ